jgi:very-short-patch-repair endonuclease
MKVFDLPKAPKGATQRARYLRNNMTEPEKRLWTYLRKRQLGVRFRRQVPIGPYIVDFVALYINLVIEIDGGHHFDPVQSTKDNDRTTYLEHHGFRVIRFTNLDIFYSIEDVVESISEVIQQCLMTS